MQTHVPPAPSRLLARITTAVELLDAGSIDAAQQAALALCEDFPLVADGYVLHARCAAARGDAALCLERWLMCKARFPAQSAKWRIGLAYAQLSAGDLNAAADGFDAVLAADPHHQSALAGRALVLSRTRPAEAEPLWQALFNIAGGVLRPDWQVGRCRALADSGHARLAMDALERTLEDAPGYPPAAALLASLRLAARHAGDEDADYAGAGGHYLERAQQQRLQGDISDARASLMSALPVVRSAGALASIFETMPAVSDTYEREEAWRALRARATAILPPDEAATCCLHLRIDIALRDYDGFLRRWDTSPLQPEPWAWRFARIAATLRAPRFPDFTAPKVFGIGLSKTGTSSLGLALDRLGYLQGHFQSPFTNAILDVNDFVLLDAATDTPVSARFEQLYAQFPNARFILTERPMESWLPSFNGHFARWQGNADAPFLNTSHAGLKEIAWGLDVKIVDSGLYPPHAGPAAAYAAHARRVDDFFANKPAGKLLRHSVFHGDGWPQLCAFLDKAVPEGDYPWNNRAQVTAA